MRASVAHRTVLVISAKTGRKTKERSTLGLQYYNTEIQCHVQYPKALFLFCFLNVSYKKRIHQRLNEPAEV